MGLVLLAFLPVIATVAVLFAAMAVGINAFIFAERHGVR